MFFYTIRGPIMGYKWFFLYKNSNILRLNWLSKYQNYAKNLETTIKYTNYYSKAQELYIYITSINIFFLLFSIKLEFIRFILKSSYGFPHIWHKIEFSIKIFYAFIVPFFPFCKVFTIKFVHANFFKFVFPIHFAKILLNWICHFWNLINFYSCRLGVKLYSNFKFKCAFIWPFFIKRLLFPIVYSISTVYRV